MAIQSVTAFRLINYSGGARFDMEDGDKLKSRGKLKMFKTKDKRVTYGLHVSKGKAAWYFFLNEQCGAYVAMEVPQHEEYDDLTKALSYTKLLIPHSSATTLKGLGYPTYVYKKALDQGFVLTSSGQSKDAVLLWDSVARKTGAEIRSVDVVGDGYKDDIWKIMIPRQLRNQIVT